MIVTDTPLPPPAENCTMLTVPAADCVPGLMAPRTKMSPQETVVRRQATTRTTRRRFTGHLQLQAAQTAAWYVEGRASRPSGGRGRPPLHQEVYTCALAPVVMEIVQTLALAQDADELFLVRRARVSKKSASACSAAAALTIIGKEAGVLVLTEGVSETAGVPGWSTLLKEHSISNNRNLFSSEISRNAIPMPRHGLLTRTSPFTSARIPFNSSSRSTFAPTGKVDISST